MRRNPKGINHDGIYMYDDDNNYYGFHYPGAHDAFQSDAKLVLISLVLSSPSVAFKDQ